MRIQYLKIIQLTCFRICFVKQGGGGGHVFLRDPKGETSLGLGEGGHVFLRDPKGGGSKNIL